MGGVRGGGGGGGRGIGRSNSTRRSKNYLFKRWIEGEVVSADAALAASDFMEATANNGQQNVLSSAGRGRAVPERIGVCT